MYKVKGEQIRVWMASVTDDEILISHGLLNGKIQYKRKKCNGKNIGRANETTANEQALAEMESLYNKKRDEGYRDTIAEAQSIQLYLPMLAMQYEESLANDRMFAQPKLDGIRCLAIWDGKNVTLQSRKGKPLNIPHVREELQEELTKIQPPSLFLDGELYIHNEGFQEVTRRVKKLCPGTYTVKYYVYDLCVLSSCAGTQTAETVLCRDSAFYKRVRGYHNICRYMQTVEAVPCHAIHKKDIPIKHAEYVSEGYEGLILRDLDSVYEMDKRSKGLLKYKTWKDDEFVITGHKIDQNGLCVWECSTGTHTFDVTPKASHDDRKKMLLTATEQYGKRLTVKYFELTEAGIPRFPVGLGIREID